LLLILVTCHITLLLSWRAVVSAISAFLTLATHCSHITFQYLPIVLFVFPNNQMMMMMMYLHCVYNTGTQL